MMAISSRKPPTLPKWPFYLGDGLLVGLAVMVAWRAEGALPTWQLAFCVLAVIAGALLLVAPFIAEYAIRQRIHEQMEAESIESILHRINVAVREIMELRDGGRENTRQAERALSGIEAAGLALETKIESLGTEAEEAENRWRAHLEKELERVVAGKVLPALAAGLAEVKKGMPEAAPKPESPVPHLRELETRLGQRLDRLEPVAAAIHRSMAGLAGLEPAWKKAETQLGELQAGRELVLERLSRVEAALQKMARPEAVKATKPAKTDPQATFLELEERAGAGGPEPAATAGSAAQATAGASPAQAIPGGARPGPVAEGVTGEAGGESRPGGEGKSPAARGEIQGDLLPTERRLLDKALGSSRSGPGRSPAVERLIQAGDQGRVEGGGSAAPTRGGRDPAAQPAVLVAEILIGIGNKLFLRGEGPGLSWERGVPLDFVEIGKYRWTSPPVTGTIQGKLYLNDRLPAEGGPVSLNPGEEIVCAPVFPAGN